jgi:ABC-type uncharacterized transport system auxiliary subunit
LLKFERGVFADATDSRVSVKINYVSSQERKSTKIYSATVKAADNTVYSTVEAFGAGLEDIYAQWLQDVSTR